MQQSLVLVFILATYGVSVSAADKRLDNIPTEVTYLKATAGFRYIEVIGCAEDSCVYDRYIQQIEFGEVTCTAKIKEIRAQEVVGSASWASPEKVLYLYTSDASNNKFRRFRNIFSMDQNCNYRFERTEL